MESSNNEALNPWLSMWTKPRATIQNIVDTNPENFVLILAAISGFFTSIDRTSQEK